MRTELKLSECAGKTVEAIALPSWPSQLVITFTDGTFATIGIDRGYEAGDETICEESLSVFNFGDETLIAAGVVTAEELGQMRAARDRDARASSAAHERAEYDRLRRKFEAAT